MAIEPIQRQITVPDECHSQRLDIVLAQLLPQFSRAQLAGWLKTGAITVNQKNRRPKDKALSGDSIEMNILFTPGDSHFQSSQPEDIPLQVVYEDNEVLVINKPSGLVVHPGAGNKEHTLVNALLHHCPTLNHLPRAGIVHRLDKETTGLLIVAKTLSAHTSLVRQMQARDIQRHYLTLVQGPLISGGTIETCFGRHPKNRLKMAVLAQGRSAITHYSIHKRFKGFTLLDVKLMTGRTHQIRVHMAHINHSVVGDPLYGGRIKFPPQSSDLLREKIQRFKRQALHACSISFYHPTSSEALTFTTPLPDDFKELLHALEEHHEI